MLLRVLWISVGLALSLLILTAWPADAFTISWDAVQGATKYNIYKYIGCVDSREYVDSTEQTSFPLPTQPLAITVCWRVVAVDNQGREGGVSARVQTQCKLFSGELICVAVPPQGN
jgi:hypothetical protein